MRARGTRFSRRLALVALAPAVACAQAPAASPPPELPTTYAPRPTGPAISVPDLMSRLYAFADDSMLGRAAGTVGNVRATDYLAREAARIGLEPAGEHGTYFQSLPFERRGVDPARSRLAPDGGAPLALGRDYLPVTRRGAPRAIDGARAAFAGRQGQGSLVPISASAARDRFVILLPRAGIAAGRLALTNFDRAGALAGAAAIAVVVPDESLADVAPWLSEWQVALDERPDTVLAPSFFLVTRGAAERLLGAPLAGLAAGTGGGIVRGSPAFVRDAVPARNVVAVLRGSDPALRAQYVALGAHSDHVGTAPPADHDSLRAALRAGAPGWRTPRRGPARADSVFNGADDDGSGSVALLEIAEAMVAAPARPRRSVLFVWHTAEELGMVGSKWFTDRPTVPLDSIVAQVNLDMIGRGTADDVPGRGGPSYLQVIGARRLSTELGDVVERVNRERAEPFALDWSWDADDHPERIYCRSDHYMYARRGIPVAFFMTGLHRDYHERTDEAQYIDYPHLAAVVGYVRDLAVAIAGSEHRPRLDGKRSAGC